MTWKGPLVLGWGLGEETGADDPASVSGMAGRVEWLVLHFGLDLEVGLEVGEVIVP